MRYRVSRGSVWYVYKIWTRENVQFSECELDTQLLVARLQYCAVQWTTTIDRLAKLQEAPLVPRHACVSNTHKSTEHLRDLPLGSARTNLVIILVMEDWKLSSVFSSPPRSTPSLHPGQLAPRHGHYDCHSLVLRYTIVEITGEIEAGILYPGARFRRQNSQ